MALSGASREVLRVGDTIEQMLVHVMHAFNRNDVTELTNVAGSSGRSTACSRM